MINAVFMVLLGGCLWSACGQEYISDCVFSGGVLQKFQIKEASFSRVPEGYSCSGRLSFCKDGALDQVERTIDGMKSGKISCPIYRCRGVRADEIALANDKKTTIAVHQLVMTSVLREMTVCETLCRVLVATKGAAMRRVRVCTSFRGARGIRHVALDCGINLFVGRSVGHPDYHGAELANDFQSCFCDIPGQTWPNEWIFIAGSSDTCSDAGEFFYQWWHAARQRGQCEARVKFLFAFDEGPCDISLKSRITSCCVAAESLENKGCVKNVDGFASALAWCRWSGEIDKYMEDFSAREYCPVRNEMILPSNDLSIFAGKGPREEDLRALKDLPRIDVLVGAPVDCFCKRPRASYVTQAYRTFWKLSRLYQGERKVGYIDGFEDPKLFCGRVDRGPNSSCTLVYVAGVGDSQIIVSSWAEYVCAKFGYKAALPIECLEKKCEGKYLLIGR